MAVDPHVSPDLLLEENGLGVQDPAAPEPEVVLDDLSPSNQAAVDELVDEAPRGGGRPRALA